MVFQLTLIFICILSYMVHPTKSSTSVGLVQAHPNKLMFCLLCGDHTGDAYSKIGSITTENAMDLVLLEQPNMV